MLFVVAARRVLPALSSTGLALAGLLFATHPIHTEAVCNINNRAELLCGLFTLLAFLAYAGAVESRLQYSHARIVLSVMLAAVATLCKEQGVTALLINAVFDVSLVCGLDLRAIRDAVTPADDHRTDDKASAKSKKLRQTIAFPAAVVALLKRLAWLFGGTVLILLLRTAMYARPELHDEDTNRWPCFDELRAVTHCSGKLCGIVSAPRADQGLLRRAARLAAAAPAAAELRLVRKEVRPPAIPCTQSMSQH